MKGRFISPFLLLASISLFSSLTWKNTVKKGSFNRLTVTSSLPFEETQITTDVAPNDNTKINTQQIDKKWNPRHSKGGTGKKFSERERNLKKVLDACQAVNINSRKVSTTLTEMNHAITAAGRLGRVEDAMTIFQSIPQMGYTADLMSFNNIIWCTGNAKRVDVSKKMFKELSNHPRLTPNIYTYGALMHGFAKTKNHMQALNLLKQMKEEGINPNQVVFTSAMEACAESGRYKEALAVMEEMKKSGMKPDLTMVNAAIKACCLSGAMEEAEALAESLEESNLMDLFSYHTLMMGHTKLGRHSRVLQLYQKAIESNAQLDGGIFSLAMLAAYNCQLFTQVPKIAQLCRDQNIQLTEASYTTLIQAYSEIGAKENAANCLDDMKREGLKPNVISYAAVMAACRGQPERVLSLLKQMRDERIEPNTILLTTAINALARGNYSEVAYDMLLDMETNGPEPNIYTYNTVVRAFAEVGKIEEALSILSNIKMRKLKPDRYTFTSLLMACGRTNSTEKVDTVMTYMREAGVFPDEIAYGAAMDAARRAGDSLQVISRLQQMTRDGITPTPSHYNLVIRTLRAKGYTDKIFKMVLTMSNKEDAKVNANTFELVIEALLEENKWRESLVLFQAMDRLSFQPNIETCVKLVGLLERSREYKAALAIYRYMMNKNYDFYENSILNDIFKRLVKVAAVGVKSDLSASVDFEFMPLQEGTENILNPDLK